jgi:uncharacterized membrane protein (DUF4010 family)
VLDTALALGLAAALGGGLLIGLERERRKGRGEQRAAAGIRSFALAALGGGIAQALAQPALVALGALLVASLSVVAYWKSRERVPGHPAPDPGLTTELALFITYLVGVLSVQQPELGAGAAAVVAGLLAARERLHRLATQLLSQAELHDALLLAALALVLLPLAPAAPTAWLGGMAPRTLLLTVVLILALQAVGHVALRLLGARAGLALSGLFSGFVSSTATIASMGARARAQPAERTACTAGALFSTLATWLQVLMLVAALSPSALPTLLPAAAAGAVVALAGAWLVWRQAPAAAGSASGAAGTAADAANAAPSADTAAGPHGPLRLREALLVAALLAGVTLLVGWAQRQMGDAGLLVGTALSALADAHAPVAALATLHAADRLDGDTLRLGVLLAVSANALTRSVTAVVAGGAGFGTRVAVSLAASSGSAVAVALLWG